MAFTYYRQLSFDRTKCGTSNLSDFPVLVSISDATFGSHVQNASGYDIVFSTDTGGASKVPWEVESFDKATGTLVAWVKSSTVNGSGAGSNSGIYMCYGDAGISAAQNTGSFAPANVWSNGFKGVWHLNNVAGGAGSVIDSTGVNNGTPVNSPTNTAGKADGSAALASASSQYVNCGNNASLKSAIFTFSCWFQFTSDSSLQGLMGDIGPTGGAVLIYRGAFGPSDRQTYLATFNGSTEHDCFGSTGTMAPNTWFYSVGTYDGVTMRLYRNGFEETNPNTISSAVSVNTSDFILGSLLHIAPGYYLDGKLDECRVANVARTADWVLTEYHSQNAPGNIGADNFVIFGPESLAPLPTSSTASVTCSIVIPPAFGTDTGIWLDLWVWRQLWRLDTLTETVSFLPVYRRALVMGLARELCREYGRDPAVVQQQADQAMAELENSNLQIRTEGVKDL